MSNLGTRSAVLLATLTTIAATGLTLAPAAQADVSGTVNVAAGETLKVRSAPNTTATIVTQLADGAPLSIQCKTTGTSVNGITQWDKLSNGYVSHAYVSSSAVIPACSTSTPTTPQGRVNVAAGDTLKVRSTPSTSGTIVTSLAGGTTVNIVCKTTGTSVNGITQWDKLSNGYVSHAYITMLNSVTIPTCTTTPPPPPPANSTARTEILNRANYWYRASNGQVSGVAAFGRNPSASAIEPPPGTQYYRRDCSGLIAMAWKLGSTNQPSSGNYITNTSVARRVNVSDLKPGDILAADGHVTMFEYWVNKSTWTYMAYDFGGGSGGTSPMEHKQYTLRNVSGVTAQRGINPTGNDATRVYYALRSAKLTD